jgi:hypothetical protein
MQVEVENLKNGKPAKETWTLFKIVKGSKVVSRRTGKILSAGTDYLFFARGTKHTRKVGNETVSDPEVDMPAGSELKIRKFGRNPKKAVNVPGVSPIRDAKQQAAYEKAKAERKALKAKRREERAERRKEKLKNSSSAKRKEKYNKEIKSLQKRIDDIREKKRSLSPKITAKTPPKKEPVAKKETPSK